MNNNDKLKQYITKHANRTMISASGTEIAKAGRSQLVEWVEALGGDPTEIIGTAALPSTAAVGGMTPAEIKLKAIQDALGGGSTMDMDEVRDAVQEQLSNEVLPSIEKIQTQMDALSPLAECLEKIAKSMSTSTSSRLPLAAAVASGANPILEMVAPFYKAGTAAPTKVCISAPPSYGKSYSMSLLAKSYDHSVVHGCSGDMDEWSTLLGSCQPAKEGGFITVDGLLVEAVRSAANGKSTLLFLDEVFRMGDQTMEAMLSFLAPQPDASGKLAYSITTKQNKDGVLEKLQCSVDMLHIVCATNLCEVQPPAAFLDRFLFKHVRYEKSMIQQIAKSVADRYEIADAEKLAASFATAMGESRAMHSTGQVLKSLSIRDLERGCQHAITGCAMSVAEWIKANGMDAMLTWSADTGDITEDSISGVKKIGDKLVRLVSAV